jgi:hypothetical protein
MCGSRNLVRNLHLATSIADAGWAQFRASLASTAAGAGKRVVAVPAHSISQDGSGCGERVPTALRVRTHVCPSCGLVLGRDANAEPQYPAGQAGPSGVNVGRWAARRLSLQRACALVECQYHEVWVAVERITYRADPTCSVVH